MSEQTYKELQDNYLKAKAADEAARGVEGIREQERLNKVHYDAKQLYSKRIVRMMMS